MAEILRTQLHCGPGGRPAGHHVVASFVERVLQAGQARAAEIAGNVLRSATASGCVTLELPDRSALDPHGLITLRVFSPDGSLVGLEQVPVAVLDQPEPIALRICGRPVVPTQAREYLPQVATPADRTAVPA